MNLLSIEFQQPTGYCITINYQLSTIHCQLSTVNYQLSTICPSLMTIPIDSISRSICEAIVAIKASYPQWLKDKYSHYQWDSQDFSTQFIAQLNSKLGKIEDADALVMEIIKLLHIFLTPSFFVSPQFAQLLALIRQSTHPLLLNGEAKWHHGRNGAIAILLLDAENLQLDLAAEQFLASICTYPLQIKVAFANWRTMGKKDFEFNGRGYELIHVPSGKDSADVKMATVGSSIFVHYPTAKEVLVCSSDGVMTHLCTTLQTHGLTVYLVRKSKGKITVSNPQTGKIINYSGRETRDFPSLEEFILQLQAIILKEQKRTGNGWIKLTRISLLFQRQYHLTLSQVIAKHLPGKKVQDILTGYPHKLAVHQPTAKSGIYVTVFNHEKQKESGKADPEKKVIVVGNGLPPSIASKADLEQALTAITGDLIAKSKENYIPISDLASQFLKQYKKPITKKMRSLQLGSQLPKLLKSYSHLELKQIGTLYYVSLKN